MCAATNEWTLHATLWYNRFSFDSVRECDNLWTDSCKINLYWRICRYTVNEKHKHRKYVNRSRCHKTEMIFFSLFTFRHSLSSLASEWSNFDRMESWKWGSIEQRIFFLLLFFLLRWSERRTIARLSICRKLTAWFVLCGCVKAFPRLSMSRIDHLDFELTLLPGIFQLFHYFSASMCAMPTCSRTYEGKFSYMHNAHATHGCNQHSTL